jgi:aspartate aminotransferase-like enzyme
MQGSGTFGEAVISSAISKDGRLLVLANGAYGHRIAAIARIHHIATDIAELGENQKITAAFTSDRMRGGVYSHAAVVHCETTSGIINPIEEIGAVVRNAEASYIVDAMSSFGAIPLDMKRSGADFLISSANKCIQGVPGFAFVLARRAALEKADGHSRTLSLDLYGQWASMERTASSDSRRPLTSCSRFVRPWTSSRRRGRGSSMSLSFRGATRSALFSAKWGRMVSCAAVANRRRPIDNRPQLNKLPHICIKRNSMKMFKLQKTK